MNNPNPHSTPVLARQPGSRLCLDSVLNGLCTSLLGFGLLASPAAKAEPVNLLWVPCTNNAPGITALPSDPDLGGVIASLTMLNPSGAATDLVGLPGSGVNGVATGATALCLTNLAGGVQPANGNGARALDNNDAALGFGNLSSFVVTMWVNQLAAIPANIGPRLFTLNAGATAADATANSLSVKFQANNELYFEINTLATLGAAQAAAYPANKWLFFAWVYDGTNLYQYDGSDSQVVHLAGSAPAASQSVNLGGSASLMLGNRGTLTRGLDGWLEDFRLYAGFSSNNLNFVENIRKQFAPKIPTITGMFPDGTALLQATNAFVFTANSASGFNLTNINLKLNNLDVTPSCTYITNGSGVTNVTVTCAGLPQQSIITAVMTAVDALGLVGSATVTFDTFNSTNFIVKAEEFDFGGGLFIDNPVYTNVMESDTYFGLDSVEGIDTHKGQSTGDSLATDYRYDDGTGLRTQTPLSTDLPSPTRFGGSAVPSHIVANWSSAEWQNYTKTFPAGNYNIYARVSTSSGSTINLDQVVSGQGTLNQTLARLGQFTFTGAGAFQWVPLRQFGSLAVVNLAGVNTLRATTGGGASADFYMFVQANSSLPAITGVYPDGQYLFEATNKLVFTASSAATTLNTANIQLTLNGINVSSALVFSGGPSVWTVSYTGLQLNQSYTAVIQVTDDNGAAADASLNIDTWNPVMQVEAEDFDFDPALSPVSAGTGARFVQNPVPTVQGIPAANSYEGQIGDVLIDEQGNNLQNGLNPIQNGFAGATLSNYRTNDPCATAPVTDAKRRQFGAGTLDYNVGFLGPGHWEQYTRTWPSGTFNVYARVASGANLGNLYSSWSQVIAGWGTTNQVMRHVGSFAIPSSGGYSSYFYTPLIDRFGNYAQLTLGGTNTFRDTHLVYNQTETANTTVYGLNVNFYMLLAARTDLPRIDAVYPDGTTPMQQTNILSFVADNPAYGVATNQIQVTLNGTNAANLQFIPTNGGWIVSCPIQPNANYSAVITVTDKNNQTHATTVNFDTFSTNNFTWEAEDFDFDPVYSLVSNGSTNRFIDDPAPTDTPATNSYFGQTGDLDIDYSSQFLNLNVLPIPVVYRSAQLNYNNVVPIEVTGDTLRQRTLAAQLAQVDPYIQDYEILNLTNTAWINYTRTFPAGNFNLYARLSAGGANPLTFRCAQVTGGAGTTTQTTNVLGSFQATGNAYGSWQYAPLVNTNTGLPVVLALGGVNTLQISGDGFERVNFFMLVPVLPNAVNLTPSLRGAGVVLSFPTQTGYTYTVLFKNNLSDPVWTPLPGGGNPVAGSGSVQTVTDSLGQGSRFYRLVAQ